MAGGPATDLDPVPPPGRQAECLVKSSYVKDSCKVQLHFFGYVAKDLFRDIIFNALDVLHNADNRGVFVFVRL